MKIKFVSIITGSVMYLKSSEKYKFTINVKDSGWILISEFLCTPQHLNQNKLD